MQHSRLTNADLRKADFDFAALNEARLNNASSPPPA